MPSLSKMNRIQAKTHSRNNIDIGWAAWLVQEIKEHAAQQFANAKKERFDSLFFFV